MNTISIYVLKGFRKIYEKLSRTTFPKPPCIQDPDEISQIIYGHLTNEDPTMIARFGSTELATLVNYLGVQKGDRRIWKYIQGKSLPWWWEKGLIQQMADWSGFFPPTQQMIEAFCELMVRDMQQVDVLGSWLNGETCFADRLEQSKKVRLIFIDPFWSKTPWTMALKGKRVLVVHPFAELIEEQYRNKRKYLFKDPNVLPDFDLFTVKAVQSLGGEAEGYSDWFAALDAMKQQIGNIDFDICLLGCGAYGFPLAAHIKRSGKKAVHWGGSLQLYFGIIGKRWEDLNYASGVRHINPDINYPKLINEHWVRPTSSGKPKNAEAVEGACYW